MTTHEPAADRVGETAPSGAGSPTRSAVVSGAFEGRTGEDVPARGTPGSAGPSEPSGGDPWSVGHHLPSVSNVEADGGRQATRTGASVQKPSPPGVAPEPPADGPAGPDSADGPDDPDGADDPGGPSDSGGPDGPGGPDGLDDVDGPDAVDDLGCSDGSGAEAVGVGSAVVGNADAGQTAVETAGHPTHAGWGRDLLLVAGVCLLALLLVNAFVARPFAVPSGSMENTLRPGDRLVVNELAYSFGGHVRRGDVVVFDGIGSFLPYAAEPSPGRRLLESMGLASGGDAVFVKRVIGVGGDRVTCCGSDGRIRVNGSPLDESAYLSPGDAPSRVPFDVVVPEGKLWVMGDHRSNSSDSRDHLGEPGGGFVPETRVIGRAEWVVFPFGRWTSVTRPGAFASMGGTGDHGDQG